MVDCSKMLIYSRAILKIVGSSFFVRHRVFKLLSWRAASGQLPIVECKYRYHLAITEAFVQQRHLSSTLMR